MMQRILTAENDPRLSILDAPTGMSHSFDIPVEDEYKALLKTFQRVFASPDCEFVSLTSIHTSMGSQLVDEILSKREEPQVEVVVAAVDSLKGAYEGKLNPSCYFSCSPPLPSRTQFAYGWGGESAR